MSNFSNSYRSPQASASLKPVVAIGLLIAFFWPSAVRFLEQRSVSLANSHSDLVTVGTEWLIALILLVIAFAIQRRPLAEFGMVSFGWRDVLFAIGGAIVGLILSGIVARVVALPPSVTNPGNITTVPFGVRLALVLTAGFTEEFMFRGFGIEELALFVKNRWLTGFISLLLFTVGHIGLYGFSPALLVPFVLGLVLTILYLWRHNLWACVVMHALVDGLFLIIIPALAHPH